MFFRSVVQVIQVLIASFLCLPALAGDSSSKEFQPCKGPKELSFRERQKAVMYAVKIGTVCGPSILQKFANTTANVPDAPSLVQVGPLFVRIFCLGQQITYGLLGDEKGVLYKNTTRPLFYEKSTALVKNIGIAYPAIRLRTDQKVYQIPGTVISEHMQAVINCYHDNPSLPIIKDLGTALFIGEHMKKTFQ